MRKSVRIRIGDVSLASDGDDSEAGDIATLEALNSSLTGLGVGWSSNMSLSDSIDGVTVETIGEELRVTAINLNSKGLTGDIEIDNWINLKRLNLFSIYLNNLLSEVPRDLMNLTEHNLEYIYLCRPDNYAEPRPLPHEQALLGGKDVHPGKSKAGEGNRWTGILPAPNNPANSILKWLYIDWTDSNSTATDGIQAVEDGIYDITTFVGLHHFHNNALSRPFPTGITNMTDLTNLAIAGQNGGSENWLTGSVPAEFGNLINLTTFRMSDCDNLTFDFGVVSLAQMTALRTFFIGADVLLGNLPSYLFDGTIPGLTGFEMSWPQQGSGFTGAHPAVDESMDIRIYQYRNHKLTSLPASLWQNSPNIIQAEFHGNLLTTIGTANLTQQNRLRYLRLADNNIHENWPFLDWSGHDPITGGVEFGSNRYVFKHWLYVPPNAPAGETCLELWQSISGNDVSYGNQKPFGQENNYIVGGDITIDDFDLIVGSGGHEDNEFQWYKNGNPIAGETSAILTLLATDASDLGSYHLEVTNTLDAIVGTGQTLTSSDIILEE